MTTISERLRRGRLAYTTTASAVYEGPTLQDIEAADTIDVLVGALERLRDAAEHMGDSTNCGLADEAIEQANAALALAKGERP